MLTRPFGIIIIIIIIFLLLLIIIITIIIVVVVVVVVTVIVSGALFPVGGAAALECLHLLCQYFNVNFPFFPNLTILLFLEI